MSNAKVAVLKSDGDYAEMVPRLIALAGAEGIVEPGDRVLLKPNLHAPQHWSTGGTTHPELIGALIDWANARGASHVLVADGPFHGLANPRDVFTQTGMAQAAESRRAQWTVLTEHPWRVFRNVSAHLPAELRVSELVFTYDRIINVAVAKTHLDTMITLGMKNLKGCISKEDRLLFHQELDISRAVVELSQLVRPDLTIVDGRLGMEGLGPAQGTVADFGCMFAGIDVVAVDAVAARAMGFCVDEVPMLELAQAKGLLQLEQINVVGEPFEAVARRFERPHEAMMRDLPDVNLCVEAACSACKLNIIRALSERATAGAVLPGRCIAAGTAFVEDPDALLIGKCARDESDRPYLPGCPPRVEKIDEFLAGFS